MTIAAATAAAATPGATPLAKLANNFNDFLSLLTTQLKNQDPTTPLDTNQFTSELVQFTSVEQQISTNGNLTQLIQATQGSEVIQATGVVGKSVTAGSDHVALQHGAGRLGFATAAAEPVSVRITTDAGTLVRAETMTSTAGTNSWAWDGRDNGGATVPDGSYKVSVTGTDAAGAVSAIATTTTGTATGVVNAAGTVSLQLGALSVPFANVQSVGN